MRLEPVYLVAPRERGSVIATRRAFLGMGLAFAAGSVVGGACGYSLARQQSQPAGSAGPAPEPAGTGDAELDALRRLAVTAPIAELIEHRLVFVNAVARVYRKDPVLWQGMKRLADAVLADDAFPDRRLTARLLAQVVAAANQDAAAEVLPLTAALRKVQ